MHGGYGISPKGSHAICPYVRVALWGPSAQSATAPTPRTGKPEGNGETDLDLRLSGGELAASDSSRIAAASPVASLLCSGRGRNAKHQRFNFPKVFVLDGQID